MGDARTYEFVCALRAVTSVDGMTADFYHYDMEFLGRAATCIINEVRGINRVVYDVTSKPAGHDRVGMILAHPAVSKTTPHCASSTRDVSGTSSPDRRR